MSLYGDLTIGVTALQAQSSALGIVSDNLANSTTTGYRQSITNFSDLIIQHVPYGGPSNSGNSSSLGYYPSGVLSTTETLTTQNGPITSTTDPTNIAISGTGFFAVSPSATSDSSLRFTRNGDFNADNNGNLVNSSGYFLQGWPVTNGQLPTGITGTGVSEASAISALRTINISKLSETPVATSSVSVQANLNSSQVRFAGISIPAAMDQNDVANATLTGSEIIVPTAVDSIAKGDTINIATTSNPTGVNFTYGGFTFGRDVTSPAPAGDGENGVNVPPGGTVLNTTIDPAANAFASTAAGSGTINITVPSTANMRTGQFVSIAGPAGGLDANISQANLTGVFQYTVVDATHISIAAGGGATAVAAGETAGAGSGAETITPDPFVTTSGSKTVTVDAPANGLANGDVVTFSGINGPGGLVGGIPVAQLNTSFIVSNVTADSYQITVATTAATSSGAAPTTGVINEQTRPFAGNILDATNASQALLGVAGTSGFAPAALSFSITNQTSGTVNFTYVQTNPNTQAGQFTTLTDLAAAINATQGLTARIANNRLYVGASDATQSVTFANGQATASPGNPPKLGINWTNELGIANVSGGANQFNSLNSLAADMNSTTSLTATVNNPTTKASINLGAANAADTITFKDGATNKGSLLSQLGLAASQNSANPVTLQTVGPDGPTYNAANAATNMTSGAVPPSFNQTMTLVDANGTSHTAELDFLKLGQNSWAVELNSKPPSDVVSTNGGQIAAGIVTFNGDGTLASISPSLTQPIAVSWADGAASSSVTINWGTAGAVGVGTSTGLGQFNAPYSADITGNGVVPGTLTSVSVTQQGQVQGTFSNGTTQTFYQIPLALFADSNQLKSQSGEVFQQTADSGQANFLLAGQAGAGTIDPSSLESSNVDTATQLTDLIVAQQAYQAGSKLVSTSETMLSDLISMGAT